jgi:C1A family cysteine protease
MTATGSGSAIDEQYQLFLAEHGKSIGSSSEYEMRLRIFEQNLKFIEQTNAEGNSYTLGVNKFADMTHEEYKKMLGYIQMKASSSSHAYSGSVADSVDWRTKGAVNEVQDQGNCGSCWAFSATAAFEGAYFLKYKKLVKFSEQQLVDCSSSFGNEGCNGGLMGLAFDYLGSHGFCNSTVYPYKGFDQRCKFDNCTYHNATTATYFNVTQNSTVSLKEALNIGPVSVAIEADSNAFQFYSGGVFENKGCGNNLDHGVTAVGYGKAKNKDYWIVRNSWGQWWGENGYIKISANQTYDKIGGICGILMDSAYPVLSNKTFSILQDS